MVVAVAVTVGPARVVVPEANTVVVPIDVDVDGPFLEFLSCLYLCSAPAKRPMKTAARRSMKSESTRRILARVVSGSLRMSLKRSPNVLRGASYSS